MAVSDGIAWNCLSIPHPKLLSLESWTSQENYLDTTFLASKNFSAPRNHSCHS